MSSSQRGSIAPGPHHLHPAYVVMTALRAVVGIAFALFIGLGSTLASIPFGAGLFGSIVVALTLVFILLCLGIAGFFAYLSYKRFLWEITDNDIHIYSGIVFKKQVHIPFQRVQSIDFQAGVIERILGIVKLKIETAGGAANKSALIPALKLSEAETLRAEVFARKQISERQQQALVQQKIAEKRAAQTVAPAPLFDPATGQPLATTRFDPQTGKPLVPGTPLFDPQTGQPLPQAKASAADTFVRDFGNGASEVRGIFAEEYQEAAPIEFEYGLSAKELFLSAVSSDHNAIFFLVLAGIISQASQFIGLFGLEDTAEQAFTYAYSHFALPAIIAGAVIIFILTLLFGIANTAISYGGFKARRRGGRIEVERGLLARQYKGVAVTRVQSVEIRQGFIRRRMGYAELKLLTIDAMDGGSNQQNGQAQLSSGLVIHPFIKLDKVEGILSGLASEFNARPEEAQFERLPRVAQRRALNRMALIPLVFYAIIGAAVTLFLLLTPFVESSIGIPIIIALWGLIIALFILHIIAAILWYQHAAYAHNATMLTIRQGSYGQVTTIIPRKKIQWAQTHQNPFQRFSKVATIAATTAAGIGGTKTALRDVQLEKADAFIDWVRPRKRA